MVMALVFFLEECPGKLDKRHKATNEEHNHFPGMEKERTPVTYSFSKNGLNLPVPSTSKPKQ
jgi:hypothetical protein